MASVKSAAKGRKPPAARKETSTPTGPVEAVLCYWRYTGGKDPRAVWELVATQPLDADNRPRFDVAAVANDRREFWDNWVEKRVARADEWEPIPGRMVTAWTFRSGVRLLAFSPPGGCAWLGPDFYERLKQSPDWYLDVGGAYAVTLTAAAEARRVVEGKPK